MIARSKVALLESIKSYDNVDKFNYGAGMLQGYRLHNSKKTRERVEVAI